MAAVTIGTDTSQSTRLSGGLLLLARVLWLILTMTAISILLITLPVRADILGQTESYSEVLGMLGWPPTLYTGFRFTIEVLQQVVFWGTAILIFIRRSDDWFAMFVSATLVLFGGFITTYLPNTLMEANSPLMPVTMLLTGIGNAMFVAFLVLLPNGIFFPRWVMWPVAIWSVWCVAWGLFPTSMLSPFMWPQWAFFVVFFTVWGLTIVIQNYREQHYYTPQQERQVRWVTGGLVAALFGGFVASYLPNAMFAEMVQTGVPGLLFQFFSGILTMFSVTLVPLAIAFSILRYRLWDIDFLINRGVVYACLTLVLLLLFGGLLWGFHEALKAVLGQHQPPTAAIVISTAAVVMVFRPAHQRFQGLVDRHLYGIQIDYHKPGKQIGPSTTETGLRTSIGTYKQLEFVGRGGMSEVYRTMHPTLNRLVAIKILPATLAGDLDFRKRFEREAQTVAGLSHANIVKLYDYGESDSTHYMVMEYIAGPDLSDALRQGGQLPFERIRAITTQIGRALDYAHQQGLVHRDIKPSNVMLDRNGSNGHPERAVLMDFGIARMISASTRITQSGVIGTLDYMAPEQIRDARDVDRRADIYSLGVMIYLMATGKLPFSASNPGALLIAHLQQPAPDPRILRPEIRESFAEAILKAMEKDPANRWQTAGEFANALST